MAAAAATQSFFMYSMVQIRDFVGMPIGQAFPPVGRLALFVVIQNSILKAVLDLAAFAQRDEAGWQMNFWCGPTLARFAVLSGISW